MIQSQITNWNGNTDEFAQYNNQNQNCHSLYSNINMLKKIIIKIKQNKYKILAAVSFVAAGYFFYCYFNDDKNVKLSTFLDALKSDQINDVVIKGDTIYFRSLNSDWYHSVIGSYPLHLLFSQIKSTPNISFSCQSQSLAPIVAAQIGIPLAGLYLIYSSMPTQYGKGIYKKQILSNTQQNFQSFYGGEHIKQYLKEVIQYIKSPQQYANFGLRIRRGVLLHGPPGTGKTMLARLMANEAGLEFFSASASQFEQIFVGVGPKRIRQIFEKARKIEKGAIIFIDEIDAIGSRTENWQTKQQRSTINQLLTEIDGFTQNSKIFLIGATNNIGLVDQALLRPGRFDLKIYIPPPNQQERSGILQTLIKSKKMPCNLEKNHLKQIAEKTDGWCGADLENLLNQSGYSSLRKKEPNITYATLIETVGQLNKKIIK